MSPTKLSRAENKLRFLCSQDTQTNKIHFPRASWCSSVPATAEPLKGKDVNRRRKHLPTTKFGRGPTNPFTTEMDKGLAGSSNKSPMDFQGFYLKTFWVEGCKGKLFPSAFSHNHKKMTFHTSIKLHINQKFHPHCYKQIPVPLKVSVLS